MFAGTSPGFHHLGRDAGVYAVEDVVDVARNGALPSGGTGQLDATVYCVVCSSCQIDLTAPSAAPESAQPVVLATGDESI
jgi:hypothetical protein